MPALPPEFLSIPLAHRGLHECAKRRPENSRAAFQAAIAAGYGIELDLQVSKDGVAMVFHDEHLDRLTHETGPVNQRKSAELSAIPLRDGDEGIPTLKEVLALIGGATPLLIEIKDQSLVLGRTDGVLELAVERDLQSYAGPVAVMSFNPHPIAALKKRDVAFPLGLVTDDFNDPGWDMVPAARRRELQGLRDVDLLDLDFVSHNCADLENAALARLKARGVPVLCWTVRSPEEEKEARKTVDNITFEGYPAALSGG